MTLKAESMRMRRTLIKAAALIAGGIYPKLAGAAGYPERPIRLVVPGGAGGSTDAVARIIQSAAQQRLGKPLVIENIVGAGGVVGTLEVVRSPPDGYTLLLASMGTHVLVPLLVPTAGFDTLRDLAPVTKLVSVPGIILATPDLPVQTLSELIAFARAAPQPLAYGTPGVGTSAHLIAELLCARAGIKLLQIPYKSSPQSYVDLMAGRIPLVFTLVTGVQGLVASGQMKPIAVTGARRISVLPQVPTVQESGIPDFDVVSWYGLMAPAGTPGATIERLRQSMKDVLRIDEVRNRLADLGAETAGNSPAEFAAELREEFQKWSELIRVAKIKVS
jgi:tripartite-type tricarboxylate transporter receptor subunit TctC